MVSFQVSFAQTADEIVAKLKAKLVSVKDYEAVGKLKTDVAFLKIPISAVRIFYKYPDLFRIKKENTYYLPIVKYFNCGKVEK